MSVCVVSVPTGAFDEGEGGVLRVPYAGEVLEGARLTDLVDKWAKTGVIEPSAAEGVREAVGAAARGEMREALRAHAFAVLGAGAEMVSGLGGEWRGECAWWCLADVSVCACVCLIVCVCVCACVCLCGCARRVRRLRCWLWGPPS